MEQSPSFQANNSSYSLEIPLILCTPNVHYRAYKSLPLVLMLSQINPVHVLGAVFFKGSILILFSRLRLGSK